MLALLSCQNQNIDMDATQAESPSHTNALVHETSPYLLQHAHNPVNWMPWGDAAFEKARQEDKLVLVSIGYSSCHWCHVMEHESFEDSATAALMNAHFVCIKVDREERPDVDQFYMDAVQLMTGRGGWPLNVFVLPDKRPVYGGTYFPNAQWKQLLQELARMYREERPKVEEYAGKLTTGIQRINLVEQPDSIIELDAGDALGFTEKLFSRYDEQYGGMGQAPKFPMPVVYRYLLRYHYHSQDSAALAQVRHTLDRMALGGIYDQIGGGFARYSTDRRWHIPHFEKMLYDNAQLMSLYAEAFQLTGDPLYARVIDESFEFLRREMQHPQGAFYAALDADSEGEEGKFYVWTEEEFRRMAGADADLLADFFGIGREAKWEEGKQVLVQTERLDDFAHERDLDAGAFRKQIEAFKEKLLEVRETRVRPGLDDKILLSWNALMIEGLSRAYLALGDEQYRTAARNAYQFLERNLREGDTLYHSFKDGQRQPGFLEDYAHYIRALISFHEIEGDPALLQQAHALTQKALSDFGDTTTSLFYFSPKSGEAVLANKLDYSDNVIAAPNSVMAHNLHDLGLIFGKREWVERADRMLAAVWEMAEREPYFHAQWGSLMLKRAYPFYELAVTGPKAVNAYRTLARSFLPQMVVALGPTEAIDVPLLQNRVGDQTRFFVCQNFACQLPVSSPEEAQEQMKRKK